MQTILLYLLKVEKVYRRVWIFWLSIEKKWILTVNIDKTTIMIFRKGGNLARNISFNYEGKI